MYHIVLAVQADDEHVGDKVDAVTGLPNAADAVRVTVVHAHDAETDVGSVPSVSATLERLAAADVEAAVHGVVDDDATRALLDAVGQMDVDAICIGGRRRSPAGKLQLKPGAQEVLLRAEVPVLVAGDLETREPRI